MDVTQELRSRARDMAMIAETADLKPFIEQTS
jgi:hypothetical protein